jgi:hypothetical protein
MLLQPAASAASSVKPAADRFRVDMACPWWLIDCSWTGGRRLYTGGYAE